MSWVSPPAGAEEAAFRAMQEELERQQLEAERLILQKQRKKEQQLLSREKRRKEKQAVRQEQQLQKLNLKTQRQPKSRGRKKKDAGQGQASSSAPPGAPSPLDLKVSPTGSSPRCDGSPATAATLAVTSTSDLARERDEMVTAPLTVEDEKDKKGSKSDKKRSDAVVEKNATLMELSRFQCEYASDEDSIEADYYEPLARHGEHFTKEEVIRLYRSKLRHLKSMYLHQADYIKLAYREKRRLYLTALEELTTSNISYSSDPRILVAGKSKVTPEYITQQTIEHRRMKKVMKFQNFKGLRKVVRMTAKRHYNEILAKEKADAERNPKLMTLEESSKLKTSGEADGAEPVCDEDTESCDEEAESEDLFELFKEARQSQLGGGANPSTGSSIRTCGWQSDRDTIKCQQLALPFAKYCWSHIIHDERQSLFKKCGRPLGSKEETCQVPVLGFMDRLGCPTHRIPFIPEPFEPLNKKKERINLETNLPTAEAEEEVPILEDLIADEVYDLAQFDETVKYLETKGLRELDSEDSDDEDECESEMQLTSAAAPPPPEVKVDIMTPELSDNGQTDVQPELQI